MAASIVGCDEFVVVTNGTKFLAVPFSSPSTSCQVVQLPDVPVLARSGQPLPSHHVASQCPNHILATSISPDHAHIAVCDDRKYLYVYTRQGGHWGLDTTRNLSRRSTSVVFTQDSQHILVADKSGDVYSFPVAGGQDGQTGGKGGETTATDSDMDTGVAPSSENGGKESTTEKMDDNEEGKMEEEGGGAADDSEPVCSGELKLGHLSMLLDMMLLEADSVVVTCDRDEKIRLSRYPNAYNIQAYCLGHTKFVISLAYDAKQKVLFSGSGDCTVRLWTLEGKQLYCHDVLQDTEVATDKTDSDANKTDNGANKTDSDAKKTDNDPDKKETLKQKPSIQQIAYCDPCRLLCVAMYRSPKVMIYKVTSALIAGVTLTPAGCVTPEGQGEGHVVSMWLQQCVLWLVRQQAGRLQAEAWRLNTAGEATQIPASGDTPESCMLRAVESHTDMLAAPDQDLSPIPLLWKTNVSEGYLDEYKERKRQRMEGEKEGVRYGGHKKKRGGKNKKRK